MKAIRFLLIMTFDDTIVRLRMPLAAAHALQVADLCEGSVLGLGEEAFRRPMQERQLPTQQGAATLGQGLEQVFQHRPQSARDLDALAAEVADFRDGELDEIFPVGCSIDKPKLT